MNNDADFPKGLIFKRPHDNAPDFIKGKLSIKRVELIEWLTLRQEEWINLDLKISKEGKPYCQVDTWKPEARVEPTGAKTAAPIDDGLPF